MKLPSLSTIWAKLAIVGGLVAGIMLMGLRFVGIGEARQREKTQQAQRDIENETQEALDDVRQQNQESIDRARADRDRGDFSHFNDD